MRHFYRFGRKQTKRRPFLLNTLQYCMNRQGDFVHFPDGDYRAQMNTHHGRLEAELLTAGHTAYFFALRLHSLEQRGALDMDKLSGAEIDLIYTLEEAN